MMKAIIPLGGKGTRLRPHTLTTPKALLHVAGKPILGHILDEVVAVGIRDVVLITGRLGEEIQKYVAENYDLNATFVEQREPLGLGHAIALTKDAVGEEPALIIYGDTLFEGDLRPHFKTKHDAAIGTVPFDDPRPYGIVERTGDRVTRLIEKPAEKKPGEVIIGVNVIRNTAHLYRALDELIARNQRYRGEFQLTDAMQLMVEQGARFTSFPLEKWHDCGRPATMLQTNANLLAIKGKIENRGEDCTIIPPCHIPKSARIARSTIGPNVSVGEGVVITDSKVRDSILHPYCVIEHADVRDSILGQHAVVREIQGSVNLGDFSEARWVRQE